MWWVNYISLVVEKGWGKRKRERGGYNSNQAKKRAGLFLFLRFHYAKIVFLYKEIDRRFTFIPSLPWQTIFIYMSIDQQQKEVPCGFPIVFLSLTCSNCLSSRLFLFFMNAFQLVLWYIFDLCALVSHFRTRRKPVRANIKPVYHIFCFWKY